MKFYSDIQLQDEVLSNLISLAEESGGEITSFDDIPDDFCELSQQDLYDVLCLLEGRKLIDMAYNEPEKHLFHQLTIMPTAYVYQYDKKHKYLFERTSIVLAAIAAFASLLALLR